MNGSVMPTQVVAGDEGEQGFNLFSWGNSKLGRLGNDVFQDSLAPLSVSTQDNVSFVDVAAGRNHSIALSG